MACHFPKCYLIPFGSGRPRRSLEDYPAGIYPGLGRVVYLPCGHCLACVRERRQELTLLQACEASMYDESWFVTLTYDPVKSISRLGFDVRELIPQDIRDFLVSLRKGFAYLHQPCRYFGCGEYGDQYDRPHYHLTLFGVPSDVLGLQSPGIEFIRRDWLSLGRLKSIGVASVDANGHPFWQSDFISSRWPHGHHTIYRATLETMQYIAGYVSKKFGKHDKHFQKPFLFQSRPSIGWPWFLKYHSSLSAVSGDSLVNDNLCIAGRSWKIPRIFDKWLRRLDHFNGDVCADRVKLIRSINSDVLPDREKLRRKYLADELRHARGVVFNRYNNTEIHV